MLFDEEDAKVATLGIFIVLLAGAFALYFV